MDPGEQAAQYAAAKLPVLPLHSIRDGKCTCRRGDCATPGKHPLTDHGKDDATINTVQIHAWWCRWPWANVGIRLLAGLIVLDVDPRNGGAAALLALTRRPRHGPLPATLTARTGGGGLHIWLAYAGPARGKLCQGVDVKTRSGYVVAPPSEHLSGQRYQWLTDLPTAPAPQWVRAVLNPPETPVHHGGADTGEALARTVRAATPGNRNCILNWATYRAYQAGVGRDVFNGIRNAALSIGLPEPEINRTMASAARGPLR